MADLSDITISINLDDGDVVKGIKSFERMKRQVADLTLAERKGEITRKAYNRALQQMGNQLGRVTGNVNSAKSAIQKYAYAIKDATDEQLKFQSVSGKGMRRLELVAQQAGYQIGDLAVQIQSGTNAAVALGQQGSQLLGFFGPKGALLGAALAIGTGLVAPLVKARKEAKDLEKTGQELATALDQLDDLKLDNLTEEVVKLRSQWEGVIGLAKEYYSIQAQEAKSKLISGFNLDEQLEDLQGSLDYAVSRIMDPTAKSGPQLDLVQKDIDAYQQLFQLREGLSNLDVSSREALAESFNLMVKKLSASGKLTDEVKKQLAIFQQETGIVGYVTSQIGEAADNERKGISETEALRRRLQEQSTKRIQDAEQRRRKAARKREEEAKRVKALYDEQVRVVGNEVALQSMIKMFGEQSFAVQRLRKEIELDNYKVQQQQQGIQGEQLKNLVDQKAAALGLKQEMSEIAAISKTVLNFSPTTAVAKAMQKYAGRGTVSTKDPIFGDTGKSIYTTPPKGPKKTTIEDTIKSYRRQMATEKALMSLTGQRRREEELFLELKYANQDADIKTSEARLRGLAEEMAAMEERSRVIEEARQQQEQLKDSIESSMGDAFMSIIDGTKSVEDAFRDMARQIIAELMRVLVVKQMVSAATGFFGFANGGVFQGGSQVQAYANGGVVGGPTYFPMAGGKTGLMGEAGPEAIMPLKRGKDGKLGVAVEGGQQQSVVINQSFNFAANGDDSVKRIIASEAPKIAKMTEAQILDNRRRGGQFRKAFA